MALTYRFYRAARIGNGLSIQTAFKAALCDYIVEDGTGQTFHDLLSPGAFRYCLARCESALHTTIAADVRITPLSPELSTANDLRLFLNQPLTSLPAAIQTRISADGFTQTGSTIRRALGPVLEAVRTLLPKGSS